MAWSVGALRHNSPMAAPLTSNVTRAPAAASKERPPVLGSSRPSGIVSRITPSLAEVLSPAVVAAPVVLAPVVSPVVSRITSSLGEVVLSPAVVATPVVLAPVVSPLVVPVEAPVVAVVVPVVPVVLVPVVVAPWQLALPESASIPPGAVTNCHS